MTNINGCSTPIVWQLYNFEKPVTKEKQNVKIPKAIIEISAEMLCRTIRNYEKRLQECLRREVLTHTQFIKTCFLPF